MHRGAAAAADSPTMVFADESFMPRSLRLRIDERYLRLTCRHLLACPMREITDVEDQRSSIIKKTSSPSLGDDPSLYYNNVVNCNPLIVPDGEFLNKYLQLIEENNFIPQGTVLLLLQSSISTAIASGLTRYQTRRLLKLAKSLPCVEVYLDLFDEGLKHDFHQNNQRTSHHPIILAAQRSWMGRGNAPHSITILTENPDQHIVLNGNSKREKNLIQILTAMEFVKRVAPHLTEACEQLMMPSNRMLCTPSAIRDTDESTWNVNSIEQGLHSGQLLSGTLDVFPYCSSEGTIDGGRIFIASLGRAVHRDVVAVELLPKETWRCPTDRTHLTCTPLSEDDENGDDKNDDEEEVGSEMAKRGDHHLPRASSSGSGIMVMPTGRVVGVLQRSGEEIVATIPPDGNESKPYLSRRDQQRVLAVPMDRRIPKIYLLTRQLALLKGQRLVVQVDGWEAGSRYPHGHYMKRLGPVGEVSTEIKGLFIGQGVVLRPFSPAALACLPRTLLHSRGGREMGGNTLEDTDRGADTQDFGFRVAAKSPWLDSKWAPSSEDLAGRKDLRDSTKYRIFSVDPPGCQDIDDTMHVRWLDPSLSHGERGGGQCHRHVQQHRKIEIGVHIADVSWFVPRGSALDNEARSKGTSVYLPHRRFDMLPPLLSSDVCSLQGGKDRLAVSAIFTAEENENGTFSFPVHDDGSLICWFGRTVIRSTCALTYQQAAGLMATNGTDITAGGAPAPGQAGGPLPSNLDERQALARDLSLLSSVARSRRAWRVSRGASASFHSVATKLDDTMNGGELKFKLDENTGKPLAVYGAPRQEIHTVIEELMVMSNQAAAETLIRKCPFSALLRVHEPPVGDISELLTLAEGLGFTKDGSSSVEDNGQALHVAMKTIQSANKPMVSALAKSLAFRAMSQAKYICSDDCTASSTSSSFRGFEHYGLALPAYTHFTSPIRRYVDLEVHRLLLNSVPPPPIVQQQPESAALLPTVHSPLPPYPPGIKLNMLPPSQLPSVLHQEEESRGDAAAAARQGDNIIDALLELDISNHQKAENQRSIASASTPSATECNNHMRQFTQQQHGSSMRNDDSLKSTKQIALAMHLNDRHCNAKLLQRRAQDVFLRLHFASKVLLVDAVVIQIKANGFMVYIPAYDVRGPVFLCDQLGCVQVCGLTSPFSMSSSIFASDGVCCVCLAFWISMLLSTTAIYTYSIAPSHDDCGPLSDGPFTAGPSFDCWRRGNRWWVSS